MDPITKKTYTPLSQIPSVQPALCTAILPNQLQCWRAGDVLVTKQSVTLVRGKEKGEVEKTEYQLCYRHAQIEQQQDVTDAAAEESKAEAASIEKSTPATEQKIPVPPEATATKEPVVTKKQA